MKKLIYFFLVCCCWGCILEEDDLSNITPSSKQQRSALALFFEQKLQSCSQTRSADSQVMSDSHTRLTDRVRLGYSPIYGGYYFVVPLQRKSTSTIDAALVYPLTDGEDFTLTSALKTPQLLDKTVLDTITNSCLFLLSNKFLAWKKQGLSVDSALYGYAKSLDGQFSRAWRMGVLWIPAWRNSTTYTA